MTPLDAFWHIANLFAPAWVVAALLALTAKLLWRRDLKSLTWRRLAVWGAAGGSVAVIAALVLTGHDGKMIGYALMLVGVSLPQWLLMSRR
ncbi:hypothetical protein SNE35_08005 [Paucibacter sp. R3-3]|uniref:Uncharacterized protein n=1 Tax=Roseateles agri TaxID=3098619 RepID=A0ABU5DDT7_9BURK|nr:hypothetical protein [Paucibacter sp. R3-3]MDY0744446.1 hypothetical protein [Paucibacter sp. R3-3]